ncbi:hypothetical protein [Actinomadura gamaensis]|uniref:Uncharacterized protein n=1 Tax=Actinomadura gamaensis TaxID=1763541 RepID=A0ABV9TPG9_9ACTN
MLKGRTRVLVGVATVAAASAVAATAAAAVPETAKGPGQETTAHISGAGRMAFGAKDDDVEVKVDAHAVYGGGAFPTRAWGTVRITHLMAQPGGQPPKFNWGDLAVDCVTAGGPNATVTGILKDAGPYWKKEIGTRMGVSFYVAGRHGGPSRIGLSGATRFMGFGSLTKCMAPAAASPVIRGGFHLKVSG